jgi:hypothetical protein
MKQRDMYRSSRLVALVMVVVILERIWVFWASLSVHNGGKASPFWSFVLEVLTCLLIGNPGNTNSGRENGSVEYVQAANINIGRFRRP